MRRPQRSSHGRIDRQDAIVELRLERAAPALGHPRVPLILPRPSATGFVRAGIGAGHDGAEADYAGRRTSRDVSVSVQRDGVTSSISAKPYGSTCSGHGR